MRLLLKQPPMKPPEDESLYDFFRRRLGRDILPYIDAFASGVLKFLDNSCFSTHTASNTSFIKEYMRETFARCPWKVFSHACMNTSAITAAFSRDWWEVGSFLSIREKYYHKLKRIYFRSTISLWCSWCGNSKSASEFSAEFDIVPLWPRYTDKVRIHLESCFFFFSFVHPDFCSVQLESDWKIRQW